METNSVDILCIDRSIRAQFEKNTESVQEKRSKIQSMERLLESGKISPRTKRDLQSTIKSLDSAIKQIESRLTLDYYTLETSQILEAYREALTKPIVMSFTGKKSSCNSIKEKLIKDYLNISKKYIPTPNMSIKTNKVQCNNCTNNTEFEIIDTSIYICLECGSQQNIIRPTSSYKDSDRVNMTGKYKYARRVHFRDSFNQYQGKQNSTIPDEVYDGLEREFRNHHLLIENAKDKHEKFSKIEKEHIYLFLKELGMNKHYENINLIHYNLTGKKPDDISYLETKLYDDFEILTETYDREFKFGKNAIDRSSFINIHFVLFQLLRRHRHPCKIEDFAELKTIDRRAFHNRICGKLFEILGWNYTSIF